MSSLEEQLSSRCAHFSGLQNPTCTLGIKYIDVRVNKEKGYGYPCMTKGFFSGGECGKFQVPSTEEVKKAIDLIEKSRKEQVKAYNAVKKNILKTGVKVGSIPCPRCGGVLSYSQATNGHIWGKCKCGISWME